MDLKKYQRYRDMLDLVRSMKRTDVIVCAMMFFPILLLAVLSENDIALWVLVPILVVLGAFLIYNTLILIKPELSQHIRGIDKLQELLEDLEKNEKRVDGFYVGNYAIVSMNTPLMIADRRDILAAWNAGYGTYNNEKVRLSYVCTATRTIKVPMPRIRSEMELKYLRTLAAYCPNCKIGEELAMRKYIEEKRKELKSE